MGIKTLHPAAPITSATQPAHHHGLLRSIARGLLILLALVLALISTLLVVLLFFVTAVPAWIAAVLVLVDAGIVFGLLRFARTPLLVGAGLVGLCLVSVLAGVLSQWFALTPPITDPDGNPLPNSIATLETVELNGSQQWITIRGHSTDLPVLLFLAGGPGGSELVMTRRYLSELEEHFIVVNWDQPGTGKSYDAVALAALTLERYVSDAYELTQYLRQRFDEEKIYVFGESWGSILAVHLVQQHPDLFHAFISTGQMVDPVQNDIQMYEFAIELLTEQGRLEDVEQLRRNGLPPYAGDQLIGRFNTINEIINDYMHAHAHGEGVNHNLLFDSLQAQEYGLLDKLNWVRGLIDTFTTVYPQLYGLDFRTQASRLEIPTYFIKGRWDRNASNVLLLEYFALLEAPYKELIWFEDSAHTPMWDEPDHFVDVMVNTVLAHTQSATLAGESSS